MRRALSAFRNVGGEAGEARTATGRRIASQAVLQLVVRLLNVALGVVTVAILARTLGSAEFGVWSTALAYVSLFAFLNDFGLGQVGIQRMAAEPEREAEWLGALIALRTMGAVVALAVCVAGIPLFLDSESDIRLVSLLLAVTVFAGIPYAFLSVFKSRLRIGVTLTLITAQSVLWLAVVVAVDSMGADLTSLALSFDAVALVMGVVQIVVTRRFVRIAIREGRRHWRALFRVALPLGLAGIIGTVYYRIDAVLVFNISGAQEAGYYGAAYRVLDPLHMLPTAVMGAVFPVVAAIHATDRARVGRLVQAGIDYLALVSVPVFAGSLVLSDQIMRFIFGADFGPAADVLPLLMLAFIGVSLGYVGGFVAPVVNLQWLFLASATIGLAINITLNLILIPEHGAVGAAIATVATEFWIAAAGIGAVAWRLGMRVRVVRIAGICLAALLMALATAAVAPLGLLPALVVALLVYGAALLALRVVTIAEVRARLFGAKATPDSGREPQ